MRSTHLDRVGPITQARRQSILRNLGPPDPQLDMGSYVPPLAGC
jgi:hypothetical protein